MARRKTEPEVEALVSGGRFLADFFAKLTDEVVKRGGKLADIHRLVTDDGKETRAKIVDLITAKAQAATDLFPLLVDYTHSLAQMIASGNFNWVSSDITEKNFPSPSIPSGLPTKAEINLELVHLNRIISSDDAIAELKKKGLRPATLHELLAFGSKYPEKQREFPIVALGSVGQGWYGNRFVACLRRLGGGRRLRLGCFDGDWRGCCRFAAVRES